jgi:hypothetical protein
VEPQVFEVPAFWDTSSSPGSLFFIGASALRRDREESIQLALEDAARKVAMYQSLEGRYESNLDVGTGFLEYNSGIVTSLNYDEDYLKYTEELSFDPGIDVLQWDNSVFVRTRYPVSGGPALPLNPAAGGRPAWVNVLPADIPGYVYGVGVAGRRGYHRDTVNASCEDAAFSIIRNMSSRVDTRIADVQKDGAFGYSGATGTSVSASLTLKGFYVLDIWIDPASKAVWTLALARDDNTGSN